MLITGTLDICVGCWVTAGVVLWFYGLMFNVFVLEFGEI